MTNMNKPDPEPPALLREEWDFSSLPERELEACFLWECAREWPAFYPTSLKFLIDLTKTDSQGAATITYSRLDVERATNVRGAYDLIHGGFNGTPLPWRRMPDKKRKHLVDETNPGLAHIPSDYVAGYSGHLTTGSPDYAVFWINWNETDNRLTSDFAEWLKVARSSPARENRGSNPRDWLKMIGAMRLLHHHSFADAESLTRAHLGSPLYGKRPSWERARKGALDVFRTRFFVNLDLFTTLPTPISYPKYLKPRR